MVCCSAVLELVRPGKNRSKLVEPKNCLEPSFRLSQNYHFPITHFLLNSKDRRHCCVVHKGYDNFLDAGSFTQDIKPTEKEFSSLNPPVEPSSEETTQFDQPEDEEKTSFIKTSEYTSFYVSFKGVER